MGDPALAAFFGHSPTAAGQNVTNDTALTVSAVYACVTVLSESVAMLPMIVYRRLADGGRERATNHPLYKLLTQRPNDWQTPFEFFQLMMVHLALRGNSYSFIVVGNDGVVQQLMPLHPDRVQPFWVSAGVVAYRYQPPQGPQTILLADEVMHVRGFPSTDGLTGLSTIQLHRETIGAAMGQLDYSARFFQNDATPSGIIESPGVLNDEDIAASRKYWELDHKGSERAHRIAFLEAGQSYTPISISPQDAQFIEGRQFSVTDIARIFRVPPHMISELSKATFSNIENQSLQFVIFSLTAWTTRIEQSAERDLFTDVQRQTLFPEFLETALLRGDQKGRSEFLSKMVINGIMTRNEARRVENMNPLDGLDEPLTPAGTLPEETPPADDDDDNDDDPNEGGDNA